MFARVVHVPTGGARVKAQLVEEGAAVARCPLRAEVEGELARRGLLRYVLPLVGLRPSGRDS
jgi:hypothetical protein